MGHDRARFVDYAGSCTSRQHRCFFPFRGDLTGYYDWFGPNRTGRNVLARIPLSSRERERPVGNPVPAHQDEAIAIGERGVDAVGPTLQFAVQKQL